MAVSYSYVNQISCNCEISERSDTDPHPQDTVHAKTYIHDSHFVAEGECVTWLNEDDITTAK